MKKKEEICSSRGRKESHHGGERGKEGRKEVITEVRGNLTS